MAKRRTLNRRGLFAAAASVALSATPALATQVGQGGHREAAGYEHVLQAKAGGGNRGATVLLPMSVVATAVVNPALLLHPHRWVTG